MAFLVKALGRLFGLGNREERIVYRPDPEQETRWNNLMKQQEEKYQKAMEESRKQSELDRQEANRRQEEFNLQQKEAREQFEQERKKAQEEFEKKFQEQENLLRQLAEEAKKAKEIKSPEEYRKVESGLFDRLKLIAQNIPKGSIDNFKDKINIALFGDTSVGKSSLVNKLGNLEGEAKAKVGMGETTKFVTPYPQRNGSVCCWDFPGKNDEISYYNTEYLSLVKAMDLCIVMFNATPKSAMRYMELLDSMSSPFVVLMSRIDSMEDLDDDDAVDQNGNPLPLEKRIDAVIKQSREEMQRRSFKHYRGTIAISVRKPHCAGSDYAKLSKYVVDKRNFSTSIETFF